MKNKTKEALTDLKSNWYLWIFPIIALILTGVLYNKYLQETGEKIEVTFPDASMLQAEKTKVVYKGVPIGIVKNLSISPDNDLPVAHIVLNRPASHFAVEGTRFYVVTPKISLGGISGLETILQGSHIVAEPGKAGGAYKMEFKGAMDSGKVEEVDPLESTSRYIVETENTESITPADPVTYRGVRIGAVGNITLGKTGQTVLVEINILNKYTRLIRNNTYFWKKQGIKADLGLFGSDIRIGSLDTIMKGGIDLATPNNAGAMAKAGQKFALHDDEPKDFKKEQWNPILTYPSK